jgi:FtsH-binding integral membrane protein
MQNQHLAVSDATEFQKATFYKRTYAHVAGAILAFIGVEWILINIVPTEVLSWMLSGKFIWLFIIGLFWIGSMISTKMSFSLSRNTQYLGLGLFILLEAMIFLPMIYIAVMYTGIELISQAALITLFMFSGLTAVVFFTKTDFSFLRTALILGGFIALGTIVAGAVFGFNLGLWFSVGMVILASGSILYETQQIKDNYSTEQYVGAALQLFASIMLLFYYILRILMSRK